MTLQLKSHRMTISKKHPVIFLSFVLAVCPAILGGPQVPQATLRQLDKLVQDGRLEAARRMSDDHFVVLSPRATHEENRRIMQQAAKADAGSNGSIHEGSVQPVLRSQGCPELAAPIHELTRMADADFGLRSALRAAGVFEG
jgi:hypothetical protein